jgi:hypothetical protein
VRGIVQSEERRFPVAWVLVVVSCVGAVRSFLAAPEDHRGSGANATVTVSTRGLPRERAALEAALRDLALNGVRSLALDAQREEWTQLAPLLASLELRVREIEDTLPVDPTRPVPERRAVTVRARLERMRTLVGYAPCLWTISIQEPRGEEVRQRVTELLTAATELGFRPAIAYRVDGDSESSELVPWYLAPFGVHTPAVAPRVSPPLVLDALSSAAAMDAWVDRVVTLRIGAKSTDPSPVASRPVGSFDLLEILARLRQDGYKGGLTLETTAGAQVFDGAAIVRRHTWATRVLRVAAARTRAERVERLQALGATVFRRKGHVVELNMNRRRVSDADLFLLRDFRYLTDLSLEQTPVTDVGLRYLGGLESLEWLNLYRTSVGDAGLQALSVLPRLAHLPLGETGVTDAGLVHVATMKSLRYLGLRATNVTDAGIHHVSALTDLRGLHLGETTVTDAGVRKLLKVTGLERLWLHDTRITDGSATVLGSLGRLRELYVYRTHLTIDGARRIAAALPQCKVFYISAEKPL